jgi:hypothetical protein
MRERGYSNSRLDNLWSQRVKEEGECELCKYGIPDGGGKLTAHHFYGRRNRATRWWIPCGIPLCKNHHTGNKMSAHLNPAWFQKTMVKIRGEEWLDDLIERAAIIFKWQKHLEEIKDYLLGRREDYL